MTKGTYFLFVEVHPLNKFLIKHFIFLFGDFIMDFIQIFCDAIPTLRHNLEARFIGKGCNMKLPVMGIKKSARRKSLRQQ